jgi:N-acetyl-anhydromuramyl-L-alanine amidase AmpD
MSLLYRLTGWILSRQPQPDYLLAMKLTITPDHWIEGVKRQPLAGGSVMDTRRFLVIHFTAGWGAQTSVDFWKTPAANGANAHVIIDRDGSIIQCRPFNRTCGHAGKSQWRDSNNGGKLYTGLNACSIGIELANCGDLQRDAYPSTAGPGFSGKPIPRLTERHKNGGRIASWEVYPPAQLAACEALSRALVERYHLDDVLGHEDCSPDRKSDPGPAFPMQVLRNSCGFTGPLAKLRL